MVARGQGELAGDFLERGLGVREAEVVAEEGGLCGTGGGGGGGCGGGLGYEGGGFGEEVGEHGGGMGRDEIVTTGWRDWELEV